MKMEWVNNRFRDFSVWDYGIMKLCLFSFAFMVAKLWPAVLTLELGWYIGIFAVTYAYLLYKFFLEKKG